MLGVLPSLAGSRLPALLPRGGASSGGGVQSGDIRFYEADPGPGWVRVANSPSGFQVKELPGAARNVCDVIYANNRIFVGCNNRTVYTSDDGVIYIQRTTATGTNDLRKLAYGNGIVVAVGTDLWVGASADNGLTWSHSASVGSNLHYQSVAFGNNIFVTAYNNSTVVPMRSTNGIKWTSATTSLSLYNNPMITYFSNLFILAGYGTQFLTSPDGITWTVRSFPFSSAGVVYSFATNGSILVAAISYNGTNCFMTSYDGVNWNLGSIPGKTSATKVSYGNDTFILYAGDTELFFSQDGLNWTGYATGSVRAVNAYCFAENKWFGIIGSYDFAIWQTDLPLNGQAYIKVKS